MNCKGFIIYDTIHSAILVSPASSYLGYTE